MRKKVDPEKIKPFAYPERYRRLIKKLNYLKVTHPNMTFPINVLSQFMTVPIVTQWEVLEHVLYYLKGSHGYGILYRNHGMFL